MQRTSALTSQSSARRGFALLVTIVLVAFLVLILVGLATFTRVETQVADNSQKLAQARQNALMGLNIALGQLQRYAGPDQRVTATGAAVSASAENPFFTGVWDASGSSTTPVTWLVSGNELVDGLFADGTALNRTAASPEVALAINAGTGLATNGPSGGVAGVNSVRLVGAGSADVAGVGLAHGAVVVPGVPINGEAAGFTGQRTIGRYAFWVGDQGVKASLGIPDRSAQLNYPPWNTPEERLRVRQQIAGTPSYFSNTVGDQRGFDPLLAANFSDLQRAVRQNQLHFLTPVSGLAPIQDFIKVQFHAVADAAYSVLANTRTDAQRGLLQDLSLSPASLGAAYAKRADTSLYMETPAAANTALPPIDSTASERRRYVMQAPVTNAASGILPGIEFGVAPVLTDFVMQFRVLRDTDLATDPLLVKTRVYVALWNPYTSALVPENLSIEITGLPTMTVEDNVSPGTPTSINLQAAAPATIQTAGTITLGLPWDTTKVQNDFKSWLPGRIQGWVTDSGDTPGADLKFYNKTLNGMGWRYATVPLSGTSPSMKVDVTTNTVLTITLKRGADVLATYVSPQFPAFLVADTSAPASDNDWKFAFAFRLKQPSATSTDRSWLTQAGDDFRRSSLSASVFTAFDETKGLDPAAYVETVSTAGAVDNFILFRSQGAGTSPSLASSRAQNDLPVFELPRRPLLSLGELQHVLIPNGRPFSIGNSWMPGGNILFDRFFFSGLSATAAAADLPKIEEGEPLANWNLRPLDARTNPAVPMTAVDIQADGADSAQKLLQAGGFNINSVSPEAWRAVLSGLRYSTARSFRSAIIDNSPASTYTGSQPSAGVQFDDNVLPDSTLDSTGAGGAAFFRFPQSASETYFWSNPGGSPALTLSRQAYRQGVRGGTTGDLRALTRTQIDLLATEIVARVREKFVASGPFRSMQEFLDPNALYGGASLLEEAIAAVNGANAINPDVIAPVATVANVTDLGFTSLTLTQADILTALAPYLRTRSDTFVVRTYGETINPATSEKEARAWGEAVVQRFPDTVDTGDSVVQPTGPFGRRFRVISFRWLNFPNDI